MPVKILLKNGMYEKARKYVIFEYLGFQKKKKKIPLKTFLEKLTDT